MLADAKTRDRAKALQPAHREQRHRRHGPPRRRDPRRPGDPRLRQPHRGGVAPPPVLKLGLSVRGCLAYVRCAKTWAASQGRTYVIPDDIKILAEPVLSHRLLLSAEAQFAGATVDHVIDQILGDIAPPAERASA